MTRMRTTPGLLHSVRIGIAAIMAGALALGGVALTSAQDATPAAARTSISAVGIVNEAGLQIGTVIGSEFNGALTLTITASNLTPGEHGLHIHETGTCDPSGEKPFDSAGGHFNPEDMTHGPGMATAMNQVQEPEEGAATPAVTADTAATPVAGAESHAGDLGNITVDESGSISVTVTTTSVTLVPGQPNSLVDADGSALVIHADPDDLHTDPSGNSGSRIACAVLFAPVGGASPVATPEG